MKVQPAQASVDVAIIGAGAAGLHAAATLHSAGHSVAVLEGRDRIGGRLLSLERDGAGLDLGATWFWANESRMLRLIRDEGLEAFEQHLDGDAMFQSADGAQRMAGNQIDAPSGRLVAGMQAVTEALARRLPTGVVHLDRVITSIRVEGDGMVVMANEDMWHADHVVIAVPPATAVARIDFDGALPDQVRSLAASTPVWMGGIVKAVACYQSPFWRASGLAGAAFSYVGPMREIHDMSGPLGSPAALFGFAQPGSNNPAPSEDDLLSQLTALFGSGAAEPVELHIHDWRQEPLTSPPTVDESQAYQLFGHPLFQEPVLGGRLHWASTETATEAPGHIEGALQAAERAATSVHAALAGS